MATSQEPRELTRSDLEALELLLKELDHAKTAMNRLMCKPAITDTNADMEDARYVKKTLLHTIGGIGAILRPQKQRVEGPAMPDDDETG